MNEGKTELLDDCGNCKIKESCGFSRYNRDRKKCQFWKMEYKDENEEIEKFDILKKPVTP